MPLTTFQVRPGVDKTDTEIGAVGRWVSMDKARFVNGLPEKIGGWTTLLSTQFTGYCRGLLAWRDNNQYRRLAVGTSKKLYRYDGGTLTNITPFTTVATTTLGVSPLSVTSGSGIVTVTHAGHAQLAGDNIVLSGATAVGGITPDGLYFIASVIDANTYTITHAIEASSTTTGGGTVMVRTFRGSVSNPFSTTISSTTVAVVHTSHGRTVGDTVKYANASAVGGITITGEYTVVTVSDSDHFTITHSIAASSTAGPGGGTVSYQYEVSIGLQDTILAAGYGVGSYGTGTYGTPRTVTVTLHARTWSFDTSGDVLVCNFRGGDLLEWIPNVSVRATPINNAPTEVQASFVTEERAVVTLGSEGDAMQDWNSDRGDRSTWTPTDNNEARFDTLAGGSELISGRRLRGNRSIVWSDAAAWIRQYTFDDFVRSFSRIGGRCGIIGPNASAEVAGIVYWMGPDDFFTSDGAGVRPIPCDDIRDYVFKSPGLNRTQRFKFYARPYQQRGEVWFYWVSAAATEIDSVAIYFVNESARAGRSVWALGTWVRTAGIDRDLFDYPIEAGADGYLYSHEYGVDANGAALESYVRTSAFMLKEGDDVIEVDEIIPDFKRITGNVSTTIFTRTYPQSAEVTNGPYTLASTTDKLDLDPRVSDGQLAVEFRSNVIGGDYRLGRIRANLMPGGDQ